MALGRRVFLGRLAGVCAAAAGGAVWLAGAPRRVVEAVRGRCFPGTVRPLRDRDVQRPGRWSG